MGMWETLSVFFPNPKCNQDFNETILEILRMPKKSLEMLLNISGNANRTARLV